MIKNKLTDKQLNKLYGKFLNHFINFKNSQRSNAVNVKNFEDFCFSLEIKIMQEFDNLENEIKGFDDNSMSKDSFSLKSLVKGAINNITEVKGKLIPFEDVYLAMKELGFENDEDIGRIINELIKEGFIFVPRMNFLEKT